MRKNILVLYTGGTIGMRPSAPTGALAPCPGFLTDEIRALPEFDHVQTAGAPSVTVRESEELLDSSDMSPRKWTGIARDIEEAYRDFDGFVVVHGTDTLAYTSSALSFFVEATEKPIVVTGAQLPFGVPRTDARKNLVTAVHVAAEMPERMAQVCVAFGSKVLRGNRATKVSASAFDAFDSPRYPPLATVGIDVEFDKRLYLHREPSEFRYHKDVAPDDSVAVLRLFPGFHPKIIQLVCSNPQLRGLVLEGYGCGNGPFKDKQFLKAVAEARDSGVVVVVVAQPADARVKLTSYEAGRGFISAGAIGLCDTTTEAALTKLYYLISAHGDDVETIRDRMRTSIAGEMS
jgi:L-asparaginase